MERTQMDAGAVVLHLSGRLRDMQLLAGAGLAEFLSKQLAEDRQGVFAQLAQLALHYHAALLRTAPVCDDRPLVQLSWFSGMDDSPAHGLESLVTEVDRLDALFADAVEDVRQRAVVRVVFARYALVCQDGIRASYWLVRALRDSSSVATLTPEIECLIDDLRDGVMLALGEKERYDPSGVRFEQARQRSTYVSFQRACDYLSEALGIRVMAATDEYGVRLDPNELMRFVGGGKEHETGEKHERRV